MKPPIVVALLLGLLVAVPARADVEFAGYLKVEGQVQFLLADRAVGTASAWLPVDGSFAGYIVAAFDPRTETLLVEKAGVFSQLRLGSARAIEVPSSRVRSTLKALFPTTRNPNARPGNHLRATQEGLESERAKAEAESVIPLKSP